MTTDAIPGTQEKPVHVFVSYAREDRRWLDTEYRFNLIPFLSESLRRHNVVFWYDAELKPGDEYKQNIDAEIDQAQISILVVSQHFLNSEFIEQREMPRIAERAKQGHMIVIPILVEPCDWSDYPFLSDRQMVPSSPLIEYTISDPSWAKVKYQILDGLKAQLKRIREAGTAPAQAATPAAAPVQPKPAPTPTPTPTPVPAQAAQAPRPQAAPVYAQPAAPQYQQPAAQQYRPPVAAAAAVPGQAVPGQAAPRPATPVPGAPGQAAQGQAVPGAAAPRPAVPGQPIPGAYYPQNVQGIPQQPIYGMPPGQWTPLVQPVKPKAKIPQWIIGFAVTAAIVILLFVGVYYSQHHNPNGGGGGQGGDVPAGMQSYSSTPGRYTILFPGTPQQQTHSVNLPGGETVTLYQDYVSQDNDNIAYTVMYSDYPERYVNGVEPQSILEGARDGATKGRTITNDEVINQNGVPGRAITATGTDGYNYSAHMYLSGPRLYQVVVISSTNHPATQTEAFLNSFKLN